MEDLKKNEYYQMEENCHKGQKMAILKTIQRMRGTPDRVSAHLRIL